MMTKSTDYKFPSMNDNSQKKKYKSITELCPEKWTGQYIHIQQS